MPLLACGAFHIAVWTRAARQAIHDGEEFVEEKFDEIKHKLGIGDDEKAAGEKSALSRKKTAAWAGFHFAGEK